MPLPESILRAWTETDYRVRLVRGGYASIRCGAPLPPEVSALLRDPADPWGYITAWNPAGVQLPVADNHQRQRRLRNELRADRLAMHAGVGVGAGNWREPSLFVPGISHARLDFLARRFGQLGVVRGSGGGPAELHELV